MFTAVRASFLVLTPSPIAQPIEGEDGEKGEKGQEGQEREEGQRKEGMNRVMNLVSYLIPHPVFLLLYSCSMIFSYRTQPVRPCAPRSNSFETDSRA